MQKPLSNSKMGKLVARLLGKNDLALSDGKIVLTDDEKGKIANSYGKPFLDKLESLTFGKDDDATDLFNEVVKAKVAETTAALKKQIEQQKEQIGKLQADVLSLSDEPEPAPAIHKAVKPEGGFPVDMRASYNKLVARALASADPNVFASMDVAGIDIADLNAEFKEVMPTNVKLDLLTKRVYNGFNDSRYMTRVQSNTDYIATAAIISEVSQQFTPKWTPKGTMKFTPCRIPYRRHKINVLISPADIIKSWLLYLYEQGKQLSDMPITRYIIEEHILPKILDDITYSMLGKGKFVDAGTVTDGANGTPAVNSMDGYETILVEGKSNAKCKFNYYKAVKNPLTLGNQELLDYVNGFADSISGMWANKVTLFCSEQLLTKYKRADFAINGKYTGMETGNSIRFTTFNLVALESMYNSPIIFATPQANFVELVDYSKADSCITKVEEQNYDVKIFGEYSLATGFKIEEAVFAAVPDGYTPSTSVMTDAVDNKIWGHGGAANASGSEGA